MQRYWHSKDFTPEPSGSLRVTVAEVPLWCGMQFSYIGTMQFEVVQGRQTEAGNIRMLQRLSLLTEGSRLFSDEWHFQQDDAAIPNNCHTLTFMQENGIFVLGHPACSPYLNPMDKVWGWIAKDFSDNGKQFESVNDLYGAIFRGWNIIPKTLMENLIPSMSRKNF